jgi:RES domain-containing protein
MDEIIDWLGFYNSRRLHSTLDYVSIHSATSAVLAVPSAVVPAEFNYLLNPAHPDYPLLEIGTHTEWRTDQRLMRRATGPE